MSTGLKLAAQLSAATGGFAQGMVDAQNAISRFGSAATKVDGMDFGAKSTYTAIAAAKQLAIANDKLIAQYDKQGKFIGWVTAEQKRLNDAQKAAATANAVVKNSSESAATSINAAAVAVGVFVGNMAGAMAKKSLGFLESIGEEVRNINRLSDSFNIATESVIAFHKLGKVVGVDSATVDAAMVSLNHTFGDVSYGVLDAAHKFDLLGLSGRDLAALPLDTAFAKVAERIASIPDPTRKAAAAVTVFGEQAVGILPYLEAVGKGVKDAQANFGSIGKAGSNVAALEATARVIKSVADNTGDSLALIGMAGRDVTNSKVEYVFGNIAARLEAINDPAERAAATLAVFGKDATTITPLIEGMSASTRSLAARLALLEESGTATAEAIANNTSAVAVFADRAAQAGVVASSLVASQKALAASLASAAEPGNNVAKSLDALGLSAAELTKLPTADAMARIVDKISDVDEPAQKARLGMTLFGQSAQQLTPLLASAGTGLQDAAKSARATGEALSRIDGERIDLASASLSQLEDFLKGIARQVLIKVIPTIEVFANKIFDSGVDGTGMAQKVVGAMAAISEGIANSIDWVVKLMVKFSELALSVKKASDTGSDFLVDIWDFTARRFDSAEESAERTRIKTEMQRDAQAAFDATQKQIDALKAMPSAGESVKGVFAELANSIAKAGERATRTQIDIKNAGHAAEEAARKARQFGKGGDIFGENKTPLESFNERMVQLNKSLDAGSIQWIDYARAAGKAFDELERASNVGEIKRASAVSFNTRESVDAMNRYNAEQKFAEKRDDPQDRIKRVLEESKAIQERQALALEALARALQAQIAPKVGKF